MKKICAVVLNYKRPEETLHAIASLQASDCPGLRVALVDNDSRDGAVERVRRAHPSVHVIESGANLGYAGGNNLGIRWALAQGADYVFVMNNDALVRPDALKLLTQEAERAPDAGILAPKVLLADGRIDSCGTEMDWLRLRPKRMFYEMEEREVPDPPKERAVFPGSALFLSRPLLERAGLFDEGFFLVHEDADLCFRSRKAGFRNRLVPSAVAAHDASKTLSSYPFAGGYYETRNFLYLAERHAGMSGKIACALGVCVYLLRNLLRLFFADSPTRLKTAGFYRGLWGYLRREKGACPA